MGPVPYMCLIHVWDQSHVLMQETYGTSPIQYMGVKENGNPKFSMTTFNHEVPCKVFGGLWDWSHTYPLGIYGTGPMVYLSEVAICRTVSCLPNHA